MSSDDQLLLLDKINSLQEGRLTLEEKVHMLEHSAAAMADELLKKSAIIQYYCMEERQKKTAVGSRGIELSRFPESESFESPLLRSQSQIRLLFYPSS